MKDWAIIFFVFGIIWFQGAILDRFIPDADSEHACFRQEKTHLRVKNCLARGDSGDECLAEARAMCLADLVDSK
jgi:hypothetical protein